MKRHEDEKAGTRGGVAQQRENFEPGKVAAWNHQANAEGTLLAAVSSALATRIREALRPGKASLQ